jgi:hypothetical protein
MMRRQSIRTGYNLSCNKVATNEILRRASNSQHLRNGKGNEKRFIKSALFRTPERMRPLGRHKLRWDDNIKMDLKNMI